MQNQEIKQKLEQIFYNIKTYKAPQLESYLQLSTQKAIQIIGNKEIQKIRHSSLLKLLIYQLVIFVDQKTSYSSEEKTIRKGRNSIKIAQKSSRSLTRLNEIKQIVYNMSTGKSTQTQILIQISKFKLLLQKVKSLQREIIREEQQKKKSQQKDSSDSQGTQIMIEQLEQIIKRKQNRIKQLNLQLQQNFNDKQQLQQEIYLLQLNNTSLAEKIKELQQLVININQKNQQIQRKYSILKEDFDKYKHKEKDQLLFGVSSFMNHQLPNKNIEPEETTLHADHSPIQPITNSTRILYKYCMPSITINNKTQEKTIKKPIRMIESESQQQDLLLSIKQLKKQSPLPLDNKDYSLQRIVLMQALFIQKALQSMVS